MPRVPENVRIALLAAARHPRQGYFENDPVKFAHLYSRTADQEVVALVSALLAFGKVRAFFPKVQSVLEVMGRSPRDYVLSYDPECNRTFFRNFRSRIYTGEDLRLLFWNLRRILGEFETLEDAFLATGGNTTFHARLTAFAQLFHREDPFSITARKAYPRSYRHLASDPGLGGASKRWNLFLRWVVRRADGVDLGIWSRVCPADLVMPLDTHVGRISTLIGLRKRRTNDWKAAEEVTASLRKLAPDDPLWFDFPLSHLGISERCRGRWVAHVCGACSIRTICRAARRHELPPQGTMKK